MRFYQKKKKQKQDLNNVHNITINQVTQLQINKNKWDRLQSYIVIKWYTIIEITHIQKKKFVFCRKWQWKF